MAGIANLVHQVSPTTGTGALTLFALNGKQTFEDAFGTGSGNPFHYFVSNRGAAEFEWGIGYISGGTLVRDTVEGGSNGTSPVNFSAGTKDITNALPASVLAGLAPLASPAFSGNPTAPTPSPGDSDTSIATTGFVAAAIAALVNAAPGALDTLDELAAALGDDANFATTVTNALAGKQPLNTLLTSIAGQSMVADRLIYGTDAGAVGLATLTSFARTLLDDANQAAALGTLGIEAGVYTPTGTPVTNMDAVSTYPSAYARIGGIVFVTAPVDIDMTTGNGAAAEFGLSIPVASNFTNLAHATGVSGSHSGGVNVGHVIADATNDRVMVQFRGMNSTSTRHGVVFGYRIL